MIDIQEARARVALAKLEVRRLKEKTTRRSARWRLAVTVAWTAAVLALAVYLEKAHLEISSAEIGGLFVVFAISAGWRDYRTQEELHRLRAELERLSDEIKNKTA